MNENKHVKYLIKGWKVNRFGVYTQYSRVVDTYAQAVTALQHMSIRNLDSMKLKIDSIECIWNAD